MLDDHEIVRRGIADLLESADDITVVGEAGTAAEALARIPAARPDVAVLDARLPDGSGIDVCRDIRSAMPEVRCLILTSYDDNDAIFAAVMAGAAGYLLKEIRGIEPARRGPPGRGRQVAARSGGHRTAAHPAARGRAARIRGWRRSPTASARSSRLIADGLTNRQIGEQLFLAEKTVKNYVSALLAKLGMERRTQAAVYGAEVRRT